MSKDSGCVGSYSVSGYTRGAGTEVSGYFSNFLCFKFHITILEIQHAVF